MSQVRIGVIGIGNIGSVHARNIFEHKVKDLVLAAVCDIQIDRIAWAKKTFSDEVFVCANYHELLLGNRLDAVLICVPHPLHPEIAIKAFQAGLHVLTEKPAGIEARSVRLMMEAAALSGKTFAIMYNQRTNPLYQQLREDIRNKKLGKVKRFIWIINNWYRTQAYYDSADWRATWNGEGGGVLMNQCPHNLDLWQWMMGMPKRIRAFCRYGQYHEIEVEDDVTIYAEYDTGATGIFITSTGEYPGTNRIEVSGTKGKAVLENGVLQYYLLDQDERQICFHSSEAMPKMNIQNEQCRQQEDESGHLGILQNFTNAILYQEPLLAPGEEGIHAVSIINAAYLSGWSNRSMNLPIDEEEYLKFLHLRQEIEEETKKRPMIPIEHLSSEFQERWKVRW